MIAAFVVAAGAASAAFSGPAEAVDRCVAAQSARPFDFAVLATAGWTEGEIAGVEAAPGAPGSHRMFSKADAGAVIIVKSDAAKSRSDCHVIFRRTMLEVDAVEAELGAYFGEPPLKIDNALTMFRSSGKPFLASLSRKLEKGRILADVAVLPFDPKTAGASSNADETVKGSQ
jgi:hypothetical protein